MIDVVLDTNVLVAALLTPEGEHAKALSAVIEHLDTFNIVVSSQITDEYRDVLSRSFIALRGLKREADALLELISDIAEETIPKAIPALVYPDEKDKPFLEAAVYARALLITNNTKDYPFVGIRKVKAGEFLDFVSAIRFSNDVC